MVLLCAIFFSLEALAQSQTITYTNKGTYTWTVPCGVTSITVQCWGGGGAGGGSTNNNSNNGGGGGGGGYSRSVLALTPGATYTINVGAGGIGDNNSGEDGGNSSLALGATTFIVAYGGKGGIGGNVANGTGGAGGTGNLYNGGKGANGLSGNYGGGGGSSAGNASNGNNGSGANGGAAVANGGSGGNGASSNNSNGGDAGSPGGGGGGADRGGSNRSGGNGGNGKIIITYNGPCVPEYSSDIEPITLVQFSGINNSTSNVVNGTPAVQFFCSQIANVIQGNSYPITIKGNTNDIYIFGYPIYSWTDYIKVFIDWNQDGLFQAGEVVTSGTIKGSTGIDGVSLTGNITVPYTAIIGTTRMRVIKNYSSISNNDACADNLDFGQTEDYLVNVNSNCVQPAGASVTDGTNSSTSTLTVCTGTQVTLTQTGGAKGAGLWEWRSGSCNGPLVGTSTADDANFSFIATTAVPTTTTYYVHSTCGTVSSCASVSVKINTPGIITKSGSENFSACSSDATGTTYLAYTFSGGATGISFTGLPAGITANQAGNTYTLTKTSALAFGTYNYTAHLTGGAPCTNASDIPGTITVNAVPATFNYMSPVTYCANSAITNNTPVISGGNFTSYTIITPLPAGLSLNSNGEIVGVPTVPTAASDYTIQGNSCNGGTKQTTVRITVSTGSTVFNMLPTGAQNICSDDAGIAVTLSGSQTGTTYQLYNSSTPVGAAQAGTGNALNFGTVSISGTYSIKTTTSCITNMNGSLVINVSPKPTTQFTYPSYSYCNQGLSDAAVFSGTPLTGLFSSSPGGLVFSDNTTGVVNLAASTPGTYSISYTVAASGGCDIWQYTINGFKIGTAPQIFNVTGGGGYCSGGAGVPVGLSSSEAGASYKLYRDGITLVTTLNGTGAALNFGNQTIPGTYTVIAEELPCRVSMDGTAIVTVNPIPPSIVIVPSSATICQGEVQALTASTNPPASGNASITISSGALNYDIPDNSMTGVSSLIKFVGIPSGATITSVSIQFNITHTYDGDLILNLKGPNGNVLNIANGRGGNGDNFQNTIVASNASANITYGSAPFNGIYLPQASLSVIGAQIVTSNVSNVTTFAGLYGAAATSANGNWIFSVRDKSGSDKGKLSDWSVTVNYTYLSTLAEHITWTPVSGLYADQAATVNYSDGNEAATVYAKPPGFGNKTFTATATNEFGCSISVNTVLAVKQSPQLTVSADYCTYSADNKVRVTAVSNINVSSWLWTDGFGSGTTVDATTNYIEPNSASTYYVTATSAVNGCKTTTPMSVAQELVANGDFEAGNTGFTSDYTYISTPYDGTPTSGLWPEKTYTVDINPQVYHTNFWGTDHTTANGTGNFMMVNGYGSVPVIWSETVTVLPNTVYYFSAYATSLNSVAPLANLSFRVNGTAIGTPTGNLPSKSPDNNPGTWIRFYGTWNSGTNTTATIDIVDLEPALGGNDFGLDDISFGTLSTFLNLTSAPGTDNQSGLCFGTPITDISYEIGGDGSAPVVTGLPGGLSAYWNGRDLTISGTPTQSGSFNYVVAGTGCNQRTLPGTITILDAPAVPTFADADANSVISACYNDNGTIATTGGIYTGLTWESSTDGVNWTFASPNYTNLQSPVYYRVTVQNGTNCTPVTSNPVLLAIRNLWTGVTDNKWNTGSNWSDGQVANATLCPKIIIPLTANKPQLQGNVTVSDIDVATGAFVDLNGHTLTINGAYSGGGTLTGSPTSGLILNSNDDAGTLYFTPGSNYLRVLTLNNASEATLGNELNIAAGSYPNYGIVTVTGANATLHSAGNLVLSSDASGSAMIGRSTGVVDGEVTVQRYFPAHLAWRFVGLPFTSSNQTLKQAWQEGQTDNVLQCPPQSSADPGYEQGYGTALTYDNTNGYDVHNNNYKTSIQYYKDNKWITPTSTYNNLLPAGLEYPSYGVFIRGDRTVCLDQIAPPTVTTLRAKGILNQNGSATVTHNWNSGNNGDYIMIGNPYTAPIDIANALNTAVGIDNTQFLVWDPKINDYGGYVTISISGGIITPATSTYAAGTIIQSGQAFMVMRNSTTNAAISFAENDKQENGKQDITVFGIKAKTLMSPAPVAIFANVLDSSGAVMDGVGAAFNKDYSAKADSKDINKRWNEFGENMALVRDNKTFAIELRPFPSKTDTLFFRLYLAQQPHKLQVFAQNIPANISPKAWIIDNYLNTKTEINLRDTSFYNFSPTKDTNSYRNRFMLVFNKGDKIHTDSVIGKLRLTVYPNPVSGKTFRLVLENARNGDYTFNIFNAGGKLISAGKINYQHGMLNTYNIPVPINAVAGTYIVQVLNNKGSAIGSVSLVIGK